MHTACINDLHIMQPADESNKAFLFMPGVQINRAEEQTCHHPVMHFIKLNQKVQMETSQTEVNVGGKKLPFNST